MRCPLDKAHLATRTQLRERGLQLAVGQRPCDRYWQGHAWVDLYDPAVAVAKPPARPLTPKQRAALEAGRALAGTLACPECRSRFPVAAKRLGGLCPACDDQVRTAAWEEEQAAIWRWARQEARSWVDANCLFVDVETSRLDAGAEIVELAVLDLAGTVLLHTLVRPLVPIAPEATVVHGISDTDVASAPSWPAVYPRLQALVSGRHLVAHNAGFDRDRLTADCDRHGLAVPLANWTCTMALLTDANEGRWPSLDCAVRLASVSAHTAGDRHRARYDAWLCRSIVVTLALDTSAASPPTPEFLEAP